MEKINVEQARTLVNKKSVPTYSFHWRAKGFIEGYDSREAEIEELKKKIDAYEIQLMSTYRKEAK